MHSQCRFNLHTHTHTLRILQHFAGADRGVPGGPSGDAVRGSPGRHPERRLVRDLAVPVPSVAADGLPRPRGHQLDVPRHVQAGGYRGEPAARAEDPGGHRGQEPVPAVPSAPGCQDGVAGDRVRCAASTLCFKLALLT